MQSLHLVNVLRTDDRGTVQAKLERAFRVLAGAYHDHLVARATTISEFGETWREVATAIRGVEHPIDLSAASRACSDITARPERPVEVFNGLGHMEVLLAAIELLRDAAPELTPSVCAPTQQYIDNSDSGVSIVEGERRANVNKLRIADLQGAGFALEAYGGIKYRNNSKASLDFDLLRCIKAKEPRTRCFVCIRQEAIMGKTRELRNWRMGDSPSASCAKRHGGLWRIQAHIVGRWPMEQPASYLLLELTDFHRGSDSINPRVEETA